MKKLFLLSTLFLLSLAAFSQKAVTLAVGTHHLNFSGFGDDSGWIHNWGPTKLQVGVPLSETVFILPTASFGTGNYADNPKDRLFWNADVNLQKVFTLTRLQPFASIGYGVSKFQFDNYKRDYYGGMNVGVGLNVWLSKGVGINLQDNYYVVPGFHNYHQAVVGLIFRLNTQPTDCDGDGFMDDVDGCPEIPGTDNGCPVKDADGDGINDPDDKCPNEAGTAATQGCPDKDGDGIADADDKCPEQAGKKELNGCPDADNDGIVDAEDNCPNVAGPAATKGCPDTDGDGILDKDDACPKEKGVAATKGCPDKDGDGVPDKDDACPEVAGVPSKRGCPEIKQEEVAKIEKSLNMEATHIQFETGKDVITKKSYESIDHLVSIMNQYTFTNFDIEGHTDNVGSAEKNHDLAQARANAVKNYITGKGINAGRLTAVGYGSDRPIADNKTAAGRTKNRRVEIHLRQ